jgi:CheY-like chemotaxis protein
MLSVLEASVRTVVRKMLERAGYTVHVAASGREALDLLADRALRESVSLVLLDLSMPGMSGDAVHRELRTLAPGLKVVYFSGHPLDVGNDVAGVIQKPASYDELVQSVRAILER